jgi:DNA-directed RNA polymerase specialized sigma24 family protein
MDTIYDQYASPLYNYIYRLISPVGSLHDANTVLQDTFAAVFAHLDQLPPDQGLRLWIYAIAHDACWTFLKGKQRRGPRLGWLQTAPAPREGVPSDSLPDTSAGDSLWSERVTAPGADALQQALDAMTPEDREVLLLYVVHGFSDADIAQVSRGRWGRCLSRDAAMHRVAHAREAFRQAYGRCKEKGMVP